MSFDMKKLRAMLVQNALDQANRIADELELMKREPQRKRARRATGLRTNDLDDAAAREVLARAGWPTPKEKKR